MDETSTNLTLPYLQAAQAQKHVTHNAALERLDLIVQLGLQSFAEATPPLAPAEGQIWAVAAGATGAFAGHEGELAAWSNGGWLFLTPRSGWRGVVGTELRLWNGSGWVMPDLPALQNLPGLGIGTSYDATNRLAVASAAVLLTHAGAGHQLKVNKNTSADTAALLFQTGWSGRAEMGTLGSDAFAVKVSADGSSWQTGLSLNAATGVATLGQGAVVQGALTGTAVTQSATDTTAGRLLKVGDFGIGLDAGPTLANTDTHYTAGFWGGYGGLHGSATPGTNPFPALNGAFEMLCLNHNVGASDEYLTQIAFANDGAVGTIMSRTRGNTAGGWSPWRRLYAQNTILGPVSQASGVPTGAILERGSNANGEFVRFADGTLICSATVNSSAGGEVTWTFPAAFASTAHLGVSITPTSSQPRFGTAGTITATGLPFRAYDLAGALVAVGCRLTATGRWF